MGCGCKNKGQQQPVTASEAAAQQRHIQEQQKIQQDNVKAQVKKTIEKYYQAKKTNQ